MPDDQEETEVRAVEVDDPNLSPRTRERITGELQEAVGATEVRVPTSTPERRHDLHVHGGPGQPVQGRDRLLVSILFFGALVVGGIVATAVGQWWILLIAVGIHAAATFAVGATVIQMTTQPEAPDPSTTAAMEQDGVQAPEKVFNELVEELSGVRDASGPADVVDATTEAHDHPGDFADQEAAMTPGHDATESSGSGSSRLQDVVAAILVVMSFVVLAVEPGRGWLAPVLIVPTCVVWVVLQRVLERRARDRDPDPVGDDAAQRRRLLRIAAGCWVGIEAVVLAVVLLAAATTAG